MPGPSKTPRSLKVIAGTDRADRAPPPPLIELPALSEAPDPPEWLTNVRGLAEWRRLAPILLANKLLTEGGVSAFGNLCATHGAVTDLFAEGDCPPAHMISQYRALVNDFGLTPAAQGKVKPFVENPQQNRFAKFAKHIA